jgi:hypothetical protein
MIPTPTQLFAMFERGEIEREELQAMMAVHARELIGEIEADHQNPAAAWLEGLLARRMMGRLTSRHGKPLIREVLVALSEVPNFPPARLLWNASHPDVPLHCFLRMRREPVFRIVQFGHRGDSVDVVVEYGDVKRATKRRFLLRRDEPWRWVVEAPDES